MDVEGECIVVGGCSGHHGHGECSVWCLVYVKNNEGGRGGIFRSEELAAIWAPWLDILRTFISAMAGEQSLSFLISLLHSPSRVPPSILASPLV